MMKDADAELLDQAKRYENMQRKLGWQRFDTLSNCLKWWCSNASTDRTHTAVLSSWVGTSRTEHSTNTLKYKMLSPQKNF